MIKTPRHDLIVSIVKKGCCECLVKASRQAAAEGATIIPARGTGIHEQKKLPGIAIEPEKKLILTIIQEEKTELILAEIIKAGDLNRPGTGIAFVLPIKEVAGIVPLVKALGLDS